jgi:hypothetical protein
MPVSSSAHNEELANASGHSSASAEELRRAIADEVEFAEDRQFKLGHVLDQRIATDHDRDRMIELGTRALRWAYVSLADADQTDAFENAFYSQAELMFADALYKDDVPAKLRFDAETVVKIHDDAYEHVQRCDAQLMSAGKKTFRDAAERLEKLPADNPVKTLTNWVCLAVNGGFLRYVDPQVIPKLVMQCTILCADLTLERLGGQIEKNKIALDRVDLRITVQKVCDEVKPLIEAGRLKFINGQLVPTS